MRAVMDREQVEEQDGKKTYTMQMEGVLVHSSVNIVDLIIKQLALTGPPARPAGTESSMTLFDGRT